MNKVQLEKKFTAAWKNKNYVEASSLADKYLKSFSPSLTYDQFLIIGTCHLNAKRFKAALDVMERAFHLDKHRLEAVELTFWIYYSATQIDNARFTLNTLNSLAPSNRVSEYSLWEILLEDRAHNIEFVLEKFDSDVISTDPTTTREEEVLGVACKALCEFHRAEEALKILNDLGPRIDRSKALSFIRAKVHDYLGLFEESVRYYDYVIHRWNNGEAIWNKALLLLAMGREKEGWESYENRWSWSEYPSRRYRLSLPKWDGESLAGKNIVVLPEQGLGDEILFLTKLPFLESFQPKQIMLMVSDKIVDLVRLWYPNHRVEVAPKTIDCRGNELLNDYDYFLYSASLAARQFADGAKLDQRFLDLRKKGVNRRALVRKTSARKDAITIGISWRSSVYDGRRSDKYLSFRAIEHIIQSAGDQCYFVNLQYEMTEEEQSFIETNEKIYNPPENLYADVLTCAEYVACCDVVVCPATIVKQLAGLTQTPCISWGQYPSWSFLGKDEYPWYPNIKVIKCERKWDLGSLVARITRMVQKLPALMAPTIH